MQVSQMVNPYSIAFGTEISGQIDDSRGGAQSSWSLRVEELVYCGIFAYAATNELVNVAPLSGETASAVITTLGVFNGASGTPYEDASTSAVCRCGRVADYQFFVCSSDRSSDGVTSYVFFLCTVWALPCNPHCPFQGVQFWRRMSTR